LRGLAARGTPLEFGIGKLGGKIDPAIDKALEPSIVGQRHSDSRYVSLREVPPDRSRASAVGCAP
jgi:hypothetical protein